MNPEQLEQLANQFSAQHDKAQAALKKRPAKFMRGDILYIPYSDEIDGSVFWVLLDFSANQDCLLLAADDSPMAGIHDVHISEKLSLFGPVTIHCHKQIWLPQNQLKLEQRTGYVDDIHLERVQEKILEITQNSVKSAVWQQEYEADVDYRYWMKDVDTVLLSLKNTQKYSVSLLGVGLQILSAVRRVTDEVAEFLEEQTHQLAPLAAADKEFTESLYEVVDFRFDDPAILFFYEDKEPYQVYLKSQIALDESVRLQVNGKAYILNGTENPEVYKVNGLMLADLSKALPEE